MLEQYTQALALHVWLRDHTFSIALPGNSHLHYCIRGYFCGGFIIANCVSQSLWKFLLQYIAIYSNENITKIVKLSPHKFALVQNRDIYGVYSSSLCSVCVHHWNVYNSKSDLPKCKWVLQLWLQRIQFIDQQCRNIIVHFVEYVY